MVIFILIIRVLETFVYLLQEWDVVIKCFKVECTVNREVAIGSNGVTKTGSILKFSTTYPCILTSVRRIGIEPIEDRQFVERQLIRGCNLLLVVERGTPVAYTLLNRILPCHILIRIQVFINRCIWFFNLCTCSRLKIEMEVLGKVPSQ